MTPGKGYVDLTNIKPLFVGGERVVYQDPRYEDCLIKLPRIKESGSKNGHRFPFNRYSRWRYGNLSTWYKEQEEYLAILGRERKVPDFIAGFYGYCDTSEGLGMVVEKVVDADGKVARTVAEINAFKSSEEAQVVLRLIDDFFDKMIEYNVVAGDLRRRNVAVAGNFSKLVLIDGLGDSVLIKLKKYSRFLRKNQLNERRRIFKEQLLSGIMVEKS